MASNAALQQYIVAQQKLGKNEAEIKTVLLAQGWSVAMIEEEFALLKGEVAPTPPVASAPPGQAVLTTESTSTGMTVLTILLLFFVTPIGIIMMWVATKWSKTAKWIITILLGILPILAIIAIMAVALLAAVNPAAQIQKGRIKAAESFAESILTAAESYRALNTVYPMDISELVSANLLKASSVENNQKIANFSLEAIDAGKDCELTVTMDEIEPAIILCSNPDLSAFTLPPIN